MVSCQHRQYRRLILPSIHREDSRRASSWSGLVSPERSHCPPLRNRCSSGRRERSVFHGEVLPGFPEKVSDLVDGIFANRFGLLPHQLPDTRVRGQPSVRMGLFPGNKTTEHHCQGQSPLPGGPVPIRLLSGGGNLDRIRPLSDIRPRKGRRRTIFENNNTPWTDYGGC